MNRRQKNRFRCSNVMAIILPVVDRELILGFSGMWDSAFIDD